MANAVSTSFAAPYAEDDRLIAKRLLGAAGLAPERERRIDAEASGLIGAIRSHRRGFGGVEEMLREYALSTREGLALMVLAEALLRVPDAATADRLIEDKLGQGDFAHHESRSEAFLVNASAWALGITARIIQPGETPDGILGQLAKRLGLPALRAATRQAMRVLGSHFVLGQTIEEALERAHSGSGRLYRYSFDMLGEGARTAADAARYFESYAAAIQAIGRAAGNEPLPERPGISVKLSALHPRYEAVSREPVLRELVPRVIDLARQAKAYELNFTVDAEEADRLELSLEVIAAAFADPSLHGWDGFGLAVQAYQKRAAAVIDWSAGLADGLAEDEVAPEHAHRLPRRRPHGRQAEAIGELAQDPLRGLAGVDNARRDAERPGRGVDQEGVGLGLVMGEVALPELVLDEPVGGGGVRHPQQRLGQHHQRQPLAGGERVFTQHFLDAAEAAAGRPDRLDEIARPRIDARFARRCEPRAGQEPRRDRRVVLGIRRIEGRRLGGVR